jgi:hypothetical protein
VNDTPLIVSFFTPGLYASETARLRRSLARLGLEDQFLSPVVAPFPDWDQATRHKAIFLRHLVKMDRPLLWLDADSVVWRDPLPLLAALPGDIAVHYHRGHELISATIWLRPGPLVLKVLDRWIELNAAPDQQSVWEQRNLDLAIVEWDAAKHVYPLGPEWCWMVDTSARVHGGRAIDPATGGPHGVVVEQLQASRERYVATRGERVLGSRRRRIAEIERELSIEH